MKRKNITLGCSVVVAAATVVAVVVYITQVCEARAARRLQAIISRPEIGACNLVHIQRGADHMLRQYWQNYGASSPRDLRIEWNIFNELPPSFSTGSNPNIVSRNSWNMSKCENFFDEKALSAEMRATALRDQHIYVLGKITYNDDFPADVSKPHEVHYCGRFIKIKPDPDDGWSFNDNTACTNAPPDYDCIDEGCRQRPK